jgi:hypothetical protein
VSQFPERLEVESAGRRIVYVLRPDLYAVHDWNGDGAPRHSMPSARVAAFDGAPGGKMPVYALGTLLAYPTGSIWVRFREGIDASSRAADLSRAGYRIQSSPHYAPNGAFLIADDPATALSQLDTLRAVEGMEHVEPQLLVEGEHRDRP